jgi:glycine oxidase
MSDYTIIGGGLMGMLVARELAVAGAQVSVLERGAMGGESSWAGGGILSPLYPWRYPEPVSVLAQWSQVVYRSLAEDLAATTGVDPEWTQSGLLIDAVGDERAAAEQWSARYAPDSQWLAAAEARELQPGLGTVTEPLMWLPGVAQVRNPRLVRALRLALQGAGVELQEGAEVTNIRVSAGTVTGIEINSEYLPAENVIVCGGAWTASLLATVGVAIPVQPVRGQMLLFRATPGMLRRIVLSRDRYVIPRRDGHVLVGSTLENVGFDKTTTTAAREELLDEAARIFPALAALPVERHWAGLRPGSPTGVPFIGACPEVSGLYVAAGQFRNGVVLGPASARLLADILLSRTPLTDPKPYGVQPTAA